jgi:hypothetical protein
MQRRRFLATSIAVTAGLLAGCSDPGEDDEEDGGGEEGGDEEDEEGGGY